MLFISIQSYSQSWVLKNSIYNIINAEGNSDGNFGYIFGGQANGSFQSTVLKYDPIIDQLTLNNSFSFPGRADAISVNLSGTIVYGLGWNGSTTYKTLYYYYPSTDSWSQLNTTFPGAGGRNSFSVATTNSIFIGGGTVGTTTPYASDMWVYTPTNNNWQQLNLFPLGSRASGIDFFYGNEVFFGCGHNGSNAFNDMWAYNVNTGLWSQKASFPGQGRTKLIYFMNNGKLIAGGGFVLGASSSPLSDYYAYDPLTNTWSSIQSFSGGALSNSQMFTIGNASYVVSGRTNGQAISPQVWSYQIATDIDENNADKQVEMYPNPTNGKLFINTLDAANSLHTLRIYSTTGKLVYEKNIVLTEEVTQINIDNIPTGYYLYQLQSERFTKSGSINIVE